MSIKHHPKSQVLRDIAAAMSGMRNGRWCENDLTAFEFGISEKPRERECKIWLHIVSMIGAGEIGDVLFERVANDRTKACAWSMRYKDKAGEKRTFRLRLPRVMRESADRLTSSGNFLQNFVAWLSLFVAPDAVPHAVQSLLRTKGEKLFYTSARDGQKYLAMLVFEGDDTLGRLDKAVWDPYRDGEATSMVDDFLLRWGWKPKLSWKVEKGGNFARVVGYDILIRDGKAVYDGAVTHPRYI